MTDVGSIEKRSRCIDVRHVNGYLIIPGIVYLLNTKLQKYVLNDRLGDNQEMNLIILIQDLAMRHEEDHMSHYMGHTVVTPV
jgi:hypothetical protein